MVQKCIIKKRERERRIVHCIFSKINLTIFDLIVGQQNHAQVRKIESFEVCHLQIVAKKYVVCTYKLKIVFIFRK